MAVTVSYDDEIQGDYIFTATSGGTVWSANLKTSTAFDYFANNAVVNDALYISSQYGRPFHDIKFYVGTAIVAGAITLVWEYKNTAGNWVTLTVTDNTTGFTVLGENWVLFTPPSDWGKYGQTGMPSSLATNNSYCWVRCRISAVTNITEGGAQSTQVVKEKNKSITVSGGTSGTPANFTDIYNADVAAGWNVFTRLDADSDVFRCNAFIYFSDYFTDTDKIVKFPDGLITCDWGNVMYANANAVVTFGTLVNTVNKEVKGGMIFYFKENVMAYHFIDGNSTSTVYLYACAVKSNSFNRCNIGSVNRVWGFFGDRAGFRSIRSGVTDIANAMPLGCSENMAAAPANVDTLIALGGRVAGPLSNSEVFFKNCKVRNYNDFEITSWAATNLQRWHAVNLDALWSEFNISWGGSPTGGEIWRDYDLYLKVIDKNNIALSTATETAGTFGRNWYEITGATALEYKTDVAPGTTSTATRTAGQPWTISMRTNCDVIATVNNYAYDTEIGRFLIGYSSATANGFYNGTTWRNIPLFTPGIHNYSLVCDGTNVRAFRDGRFIGHTTYADAKALDGAGKWGSRYNGDVAYNWDYNLVYAVIHDIALSEDQVKTLHEQFEGKKTVQLEDKDGDIQLNCFLSPDGYLNRDFGTATSGTTTTLTDTTKSWPSSSTACPQWTGHDLLITSGTGSGQRTTILSNTATVLTVSTLATAPDSTSKYVIIPMITHSKWNYLNGTTPSDTYNDYTLKISKSGYYFRPMTLTIDRKIDDVISLERVLDNNFSKLVTINTK